MPDADAATSDFVIRHSSLNIRHSSLNIRHSSLNIRHSSFVIEHSSFVIEHSSFVIPPIRLIRKVNHPAGSGPINGQYALQEALRERLPGWLKIGVHRGRFPLPRTRPRVRRGGSCKAVRHGSDRGCGSGCAGGSGPEYLLKSNPARYPILPIYPPLRSR